MVLHDCKMSHWNRIKSLFISMCIIYIILIVISLLISRSGSKVALFVPLVLFVSGMLNLIYVYKTGINWIELIDIDESTRICKLRLVKKNKIFFDNAIPIDNITFKLLQLPGNPTPSYKLNIYYKGDLLFTQNQISKLNKMKMQEIFRYFHPNVNLRFK